MLNKTVTTNEQSLSFLGDTGEKEIIVDKEKLVHRLFKAIKTLKEKKNEILFHFKHINDILKDKQNPQLLDETKKELRQAKSDFNDLIDDIERKDIRYKASYEQLQKMDLQELAAFRGDIKEKRTTVFSIEKDLSTVKSKLIKDETLGKLESYELHVNLEKRVTYNISLTIKIDK